MRKNIVENYYRILSLANVTVNKLAKPTAETALTYLSDQMSPGMLRQGMKFGKKIAMRPMNRVGDYLDQSVLEMETQLKKEYGIDTNQWMFSLDNLDMMGKINALASSLFQEVNHIKRYDFIKYLTVWAMLQGLYLSSYEKKLAIEREKAGIPQQSSDLPGSKQIQEELLHYCVLANGTYGKAFNIIYNERRNPRRLLKQTDNIEDFILHTGIPEAYILHSFWESTPYKPAYVIVKDHAKSAITLCMRGTNHWSDLVTDLDSHYLKFSIVRDVDRDQLFMRFHFSGESQEYLRKRLGEDTRCLNEELRESTVYNEEVLETGHAHAGMLVSAIGAYSDITPKLEESFRRPGLARYNLVVTGHSLGGGMSTLMSLLYLVHPLKSMKGSVEQRVIGYSFGGASVLSADFDKRLKNVMKTVVFGYDYVPRLSYGSVNDICKVILAFDEINNKEPAKFEQMMNLDVSANLKNADSRTMARIQQYADIYESFKQEYLNSPKLFPMGRVYHIQDLKAQLMRKDKDDYDFTLREVQDKGFFNEIIFSRQLIKHHFFYMYQRALSSSSLLVEN